MLHHWPSALLFNIDDLLNVYYEVEIHKKNESDFPNSLFYKQIKTYLNFLIYIEKNTLFSYASMA